MNNQGLLSLAQLILPSEILSNFEVVRVEEEEVRQIVEDEITRIKNAPELCHLIRDEE